MKINLVPNVKKYEKLVKILKCRRDLLGLKQSDICKGLGVSQSWVSKVEGLEVKIDIETLFDYADFLQLPFDELLIGAGFLKGKTETNNTNSSTSNTIVPSPKNSVDIGNSMRLCLLHDEDKYFVDIADMNTKEYIKLDAELHTLFERASTDKKFKNRDAISEALYRSITLFPKTNPSDLYHHIVYRTYLRDYKASNTKQSWARAGGEAVELLLKKIYARRLWDEGILIQLAFDKDVSKNQFLKDMGLADVVSGESKLDIGLYGIVDDELIIFGGIHSKASLAERVTDDIPCSVAMMKSNYYSYLFTFDAKSFPPPNGKLINAGELGSVHSPSDKRKYIEKYGQFSSCFSFNFKTSESPIKTVSGNKIIVPSKMSESDEMIEKIISDWREFKEKL
jgi:transcriptional regulator with XRE-family HTH domain